MVGEELYLAAMAVMGVFLRAELSIMLRNKQLRGAEEYQRGPGETGLFESASHAAVIGVLRGIGIEN